MIDIALKKGYISSNDRIYGPALQLVENPYEPF